MNKVIAIVGPTASGKTKLAIDMALQLKSEIISADSRLVYKGFDIATAKPTKDEQNLVRHHLIDVVEPEFDYSVADYVDAATDKIQELHSKNIIPIVVGGTGLYFRILLENYSLPRIEANPVLRAELEIRETKVLYDELQRLDTVAAAKIHPNNRVRVIRALEVCKTLNKPFSEACGLKEKPYDVEWIFPEIESRDWLYDRINQRVDMMLDLGLIDETKLLLKKHGRIKNLVNTIGYQEMIAYLDGSISLQDAVEKLKQNTRRYAKRQLTWFRKNPNLNFDI